MSEILYQGHGSIRITSSAGTVVYIDPFMGNGYDKPADLILVSHQHHDHNRIDLPIKKEDCIIWHNADALKNGVYGSITVKDITVTATEAYNKNHSKDSCVGFLIEFDGVTVYTACDTSETTEMPKLAEMNIDYAFLPIDGVYNMNASEASKCAELIKAKHTVPYHMSPGKPFDRTIAETFVCENRFILADGDTIVF